MPKFKKENKGGLTQPWNNPNSIYNKITRSGTHTGVDYVVGHGKPVVADNDGYVYKTWSKGQLKSNWTGVYMLVDIDDEWAIEIVQGHFLENKVKAGEQVKAGDVIGLQGNFGYVWGTYPDGVKRQVPVSEQLNGSAGSIGSHVHESWRLVKKVSKPTRGMTQLKTSNGKKLKLHGKYYEFKYDDMRGTVDPIKKSRELNRSAFWENLKQQTMIALLKLQIQVKLAQVERDEEHT